MNAIICPHTPVKDSHTVKALSPYYKLTSHVRGSNAHHTHTHTHTHTTFVITEIIITAASGSPSQLAILRKEIHDPRFHTGQRVWHYCARETEAENNGGCKPTVSSWKSPTVSSWKSPTVFSWKSPTVFSWKSIAKYACVRYSYCLLEGILLLLRKVAVTWKLYSFDL